MEKSRKSVATKFFVFFLSSLVLFSVGLFALPTSAYEIDGLPATAVTITRDDILAMFNAGDITINYRIDLLSGSFNYYNMLTHNSGNNSSVDTYTYSINNCERFSRGLFFWGNFAFLLQPSSSCNVNIGLTFPFEYYIDRSVFYAPELLYTGLIDNTITCNFYVLDSSNNVINSRSFATSTTGVYWSDNNLYSEFFVKYNWLPGSSTSFDNTSTGIKGRVPAASASYSLTSNNTLASSLMFSSTVDTSRSIDTGNTFDYYGALAFYWPFTSITVYVPTDFEVLVNDYLSLITSDSPTAAQTQRINELRSTFNDKKQDMDDLVDDLDVPFPDDIPDVSTLDDEVTDAIEDSSTVVVSPILNNPFVVTLISSVLVFTAIKLLLLGSGPS